MKLLGKIKIHEIAKKMGLASKDVLEKAKSLNFDVKSHLSAVTDEEAKKLEEELKKKTPNDYLLLLFLLTMVEKLHIDFFISYLITLHFKLI